MIPHSTVLSHRLYSTNMQRDALRLICYFPQSPVSQVKNHEKSTCKKFMIMSHLSINFVLRLVAILFDHFQCEHIQETPGTRDLHLAASIEQDRSKFRLNYRINILIILN